MLNNLQHNHLENEYLNPTQIDQNKDAKYQTLFKIESGCKIQILDECQVLKIPGAMYVSMNNISF